MLICARPGEGRQRCGLRTGCAGHQQEPSPQAGQRHAAPGTGTPHKPRWRSTGTHPPDGAVSSADSRHSAETHGSTLWPAPMPGPSVNSPVRSCPIPFARSDHRHPFPAAQFLTFQHKAQPSALRGPPSARPRGHHGHTASSRNPSTAVITCPSTAADADSSPGTNIP